MTYVTDPAKVQEIAVRLHDKAQGYAELPAPAATYPHLAARTPEDWTAFVEALATARQTADDGGRITVLLRVYGSYGLAAVAEQWIAERIQDRKKAEAAAWIAASYEVQDWRGAVGFGKPTRIAKTDVDAWLRPGYVLIERRPEVTLPEDTGHDELSFPGLHKIRTARLGTERPDGTVKAKRILYRETGRVVQYQVKPRSKAAEAKYQAIVRVRAIETNLRINLDYMTADQIAQLRGEADKLRAQHKL